MFNISNDLFKYKAGYLVFYSGFFTDINKHFFVELEFLDSLFRLLKV